VSPRYRRSPLAQARRRSVGAFPRCGAVVRDRVQGSRMTAFSVLRGRRRAWYGRRWTCARPARHGGPCAPAATEADQTDVLLDRWRTRR
jgi:hypothetical protein